MSKTDKLPTFVKRDPIVSGKVYMQLLKNLKERFRRSQIKAAVSVNTEMLEFYWAMGRAVSQLHRHARYGSAFFDCLSLDLREEFPEQTGFSAANIRYTKRWYEFYNPGNVKRQPSDDDFKKGNLQQVAEDLTDQNLQQPAEDSCMPYGFAYVGRQMELKMPGGQVFMPDMIFYNYKIKAFIVCELNQGERAFG